LLHFRAFCTELTIDPFTLKLIAEMIRIFTLLLALAAAAPAWAQNLVAYELRESMTAAEVDAYLGSSVPNVSNGVDIYNVFYTMDDVQGMLDTASGALYIPAGTDLASFPLVCDMHGTTDRTWYPSLSPDGGTGIYFGANGFITFEPDYLGLGSSRGFHPYIHADSEARAGVEMLRAVHDILAELNIAPQDELFITGYSQGGHSAMAMHRMIQEDLSDEFTVTASSPMSGPYSISGIMFDRMMDDQNYLPGVVFLPYVVISYQTVYGNIYNDLSDIFKSQYVNPIRNFAQGTSSINNMSTNLFLSLLAFTGGSNPRNMLQDSVVARLQTDPESHPMYQALLDNDLLDWVPQAPMRLFHCEADEQVPYTNSILAEEIFMGEGAPEVIAESRGTTLNHAGCVWPATHATLEFFQGFLVTNTQEVIAESGLEVFPNPASSWLHLRRQDNQAYLDAEVTIFDLNGRLISRLMVPDGLLNVQHLHAGMYVLRIASQEGVATVKFNKI
jgi:hypothetical protein